VPHYRRCRLTNSPVKIVQRGWDEVRTRESAAKHDEGAMVAERTWAKGIALGLLQEEERKFLVLCLRGANEAFDAGGWHGLGWAFV
jgi:hypothetical protein